MKKETVDENKPWQHGHSLEFLKKLEGFFTDYNTKVRSPFAAFKKNSIAASLHDDELIAVFPSGTDKPKTLAFAPSVMQPMDKAIGMFTMSEAKVRSEITMFPDVVIGVKEPGDRVVQRFVCEPGSEELFVEGFKTCPWALWMYILEEDAQQKRVAKLSGFKRIGVKINTHSDIFGVYFKDARPNALQVATGDVKTRPHPKVSKFEDYALELMKIKKLPDFKKDLKATIERVKNFKMEFTDHYSNYNKDHAWGALSIRGYSPDPTFITKPAEMNDKWNEEHKDEKFEMQFTELSNSFPEAVNIVTAFAGQGEIHRIRLMRLQPGGGELERHTDQVDKDSGIGEGKVMRIHVPLVTNKDVKFTLWGVDGKPKQMHFPVGSAFYLDTRKPHTAVNFGKSERIHLVMDLEATDHLRSLLDV
jgi:hypothetical protein